MAKRYIWNRYSLESSYEIGTAGTASYAKTETLTSKAKGAYFAKSVTYDEDTGYFTGVSTKYINVGAAYSSGGPGSSYPYYLGSSKTSTTCYYTSGYWITSVVDEDSSYFSIYATAAVYKVVAEEVYSQGDTDYGYVSSNSSGTYPTGGQSGGYWYAYLGSDTIDVTAVSCSPEEPEGGDTVTITLTAPSAVWGGTVTYHYEVSLDGEDYEVLSDTTGTAVAFTVPTGTETLQVRVYVSDDMGYTGSTYTYSGELTVTNNTAPSAPGSVTVASEYFYIAGKSLTVTWEAAEDEDDNLEGYLVQRSYNGGSWTQVYQGASLTLTASTGSSWTTVQYRVRAYDEGDLYSDWTYSDTVSLISNSAPSAPTAVTIPATIYPGAAFKISWTAASDADGDTVYYQVQYTLDSGSSWSDFVSVDDLLTAVSVTVTLSDGSGTIQVRVRAFDDYAAATGYSDWAYSTERTIRTTNAAPAVTVTVDGEDVSDGSDLGTFSVWNAGPALSAVLEDSDGDDLTADLSLDGTVLVSASYAAGDTVEIVLADVLEAAGSSWMQVLNGSHTMTLSVTDGTDTAAWTGTFAKAVTALSVSLAENLTVDGTITGVVMTLSGSIPDDAVFSCAVTADGSTWEDNTTEALAGGLYSFAATGSSFNFLVELENGGTEGYLTSIQGALAVS